MSILRTAVLVLVLAATRVAAAQPHLAQKPSPANKRWYGWQVLAVDAVGLSMFGIGVATETRWVGGLGAAVYWVGGPTVHLAHDNGGRGFASFALARPAGAVAGAGVALSTCGWGACRGKKRTSATVGAIAMLAGVSLVDAALGRESTKLAPIVEPDGARGVALVGTF